jgi:hypothetical protein
MTTHNNRMFGILSVATAAALTVPAMMACTVDEDIPETEAYDIMREVDEPELVDDVDASEVDSNATGPLEAELPLPPAAVISVYQRVGDRIEPLGGKALVLYRRWTLAEGWDEIHEAQCANPNCTVATIARGLPGYYLIGAFGCGDYALSGIEVRLKPDGSQVDTVRTPLVLDDVSPRCLTEDDVQPPRSHPTSAEVSVSEGRTLGVAAPTSESPGAT